MIRRPPAATYVSLSSCFTRYFFKALFFLLVLAPGCKKNFDKYYGNTGPAGVYLYDKLKHDSNFSIFARGLERTGLVQYINNGGVYTVFAPVNSAFQQYFVSKGYASVEVVPVDTLFSLLNFHVINNLWYYYTLQQRYATTGQLLFLTRGRKFMTIDVTAHDTLKVNGVPVIKGLRDIGADNAVIHGIGSVLLQMPNLEQVLQNDPRFSHSTFYRLMQVLKDSAFDRFNSFDKNGDGRPDSVFYKTYDLLYNVNTAIEYKQNTNATSQGGDPVFSTILMPVDDSLNALIAPALAKVDPGVTDKIAALSPTYAEAVLEPYFMYDTAAPYTSDKLINRIPGKIYAAINGQVLPLLTDGQFVRKDARASNGVIHVLNATFARSDRLQSALGQASTDPDLAMFMAALQQAGLMSTLGSGSRVGSYFAPGNAAFAAAGLDVRKMTLNGVALTTLQLANIMRNHVIDQNLSSASALTGTIGSDFGAGNALTFTNGGTTVATTYSGAQTGIVANVTLPFVTKGPGNGYVYKIDKLLIPNGY